MNRTLGFFLGSAVVLAMLVLILGQPVPLAPPADRDRLPGADASARPAAVRMSQPEAEPGAHSPLQSSIMPVQDSPAPAPLEPSQPLADEVPPSAVTPEPDTTTATAGIEDQDENEMVDAWLASSAVQPADNTVVDPATTDGQVASMAGAAAAQSGAEAPDTGWFPLWDPFHSELSANAFARRLERVTGLDYRVIKTGPAEYRVTVGYTSEEQRVANLNLIEEATGLTLSGGSL